MPLNMKERKAVTKRLKDRYLRSSKKEKKVILDEFCFVTRYNRTYAARALRKKNARKKPIKRIRERPRKYGDEVVRPLKKIWATLDFICGKRLKPFMGEIVDQLERFGERALLANESVKVNSMCTVFAESEVVSLLARKFSASSIALGLHEAIAERMDSMARRTGIIDQVVFSGGVAYNPCVKALLEKRLGVSLKISERPELTGALGAALIAQRG